MHHRFASLAAAALLFALAACGHGHRDAPRLPAPPPPWRTLATDEDRARLWNWRTTFVAAIAAARRSDPDQVAAAGALLAPDAALADPAPPSGSYRCRLLRLGTGTPGMPGYAAGAPQPCRIVATPDGQSFATDAGDQRPGGRLLPQDERRLVLLGAMRLAGEQGAFAYGRDRERDLAGYLERIEARRWRLLIPGPRWDTQFLVVELLPTDALPPREPRRIVGGRPGGRRAR